MDMEAKLARLRAVANPARLDILEVLRAGGPATAGQITKAIPRVSGGLTHHLRILVDQQFIEQDSEGRYTAKVVPITWDADEYDDDTWRLTVATVNRVLVQRRIDRLRGWSDSSANWSKDWRDNSFSDDSLLTLNAEELDQLGSDLDEVLDKYRALTRSRVGRDDPALQSVFMLAVAFPVEL